MFNSFNLETSSTSELVEITHQVQEIVQKSGIQEGICLLATPHTTAALTITSYHDRAGFEDLRDEVSRLIPTRIDFKHQFDTPTDAAGHIKSSLIGVSLPLIISQGKLLLGHSQGIYFFEFDGPRQRTVNVQMVGA